MAEVTDSDIFSSTQIFVSFDSSIKTDNQLFDKSNYTLTDSNSNLINIIRVIEVPSVTVSTIFLEVEPLSDGVEYTVTLTAANITAADGTTLDPNANFAKFIGRQTKTDLVIKNKPSFYNTKIGSNIYAITSAIGRQDDLIGGSLEEPSFFNDSAPPSGPIPLPNGLSDLVNPSNLVPAMGAQGVLGDPEWYWMGRDNSGASDLIGSDNLVDVGSVIKNVNDPSFSENVTQFTFNSTASMDAQNATVASVSTESFSFVFIGRAFLSTTGRQWFGKMVTSVGPGYEFQSDSSGIRFTYFPTSPAINSSAVINVAHDDGNAHAIGGTVNFNTGNIELFSNLGSDSQPIVTQQDISNAAIFSLGSNRLLVESLSVALFAFWRGVAAEGMVLQHILNLNTGLGL